MRQRREVTLAFQTNKTSSEYAALAAQVESFGFDGLTVYGDLMFQPPIGPLLTMAHATTHIRLGAASYNPYTLHPVEIAGQVALLDDVSAGRAYWGIARGAWLDSLGLAQPKPVTTVREAIGVVRHLLAKRQEPFVGERFRLSAHHQLQYAVRRADVPVLVGAWGPRLAAVGGELADEVKIGGSANPAIVPLMRERIAVGAMRAMRDVNAMGLVIGAVTVVDNDGAVARRKAKAEVALYLPTVAALDPTTPVDPELIAQIQEATEAGSATDAAALISDDLLSRFAFAGTPADLIAHAEALFAAGVTRIEFGTPHGLSDEKGVRLLGEKVLPTLRLAPRPVGEPRESAASRRTAPQGVASQTSGTYRLWAGPFMRFMDVRRFHTMLREVPGIRNLYVRRFVHGTIEITLDHNGATPLITYLRAASFITRVDDIGPYHFRLHVKPIPPPPSAPPVAHERHERGRWDHRVCHDADAPAIPHHGGKTKRDECQIV